MECPTVVRRYTYSPITFQLQSTTLFASFPSDLIIAVHDSSIQRLSRPPLGIKKKLRRASTALVLTNLRHCAMILHNRLGTFLELEFFGRATVSP